MGADFIYAIIPVCYLTDDRKDVLKAKVGKMTDEDLLEHDIIYGPEDVLSFIDEYERLDASRETSWLFPPKSEYGFYLTAGMSWGDVPTGVYSTIECLSLVFWDEFEEWAIEDERERIATHVAMSAG